MKVENALHWLFNYHPKEVLLRSPHAIEECRDRIENSTASSWALFSSRRVKGWVQGSNLQLRQQTMGKNTFQLILYGKLDPNPCGTQISCTFSMLPVAIAIAVLGITVFPTIGLVVGWDALADLIFARGNVSAGVFWEQAVKAGQLIFIPFLVLTMCRLFTAGAKDFLIEHLEDVLDAKVVTDNEGVE